jgi:hypothetical protein
MKSRLYIWVALFAVCVTLGSSPSVAQQTSIFTYYGSVSHENGQPVSEALIVEVENVTRGYPLSAVVGARGLGLWEVVHVDYNTNLAAAAGDLISVTVRDSIGIRKVGPISVTVSPLHVTAARIRIDLEVPWPPTPVGLLASSISYGDGRAVVSWSLTEEGRALPFKLWKRKRADGLYIKIREPATRRSGEFTTFEDHDVLAGATYDYRLTLHGERVFTYDLGTVAIPSGRFALYQNVPNPFNPRTQIRFDLTDKALVTLEVFTSTGRIVRTLVNGRELPAGSYTEGWNGTDDDGLSVSSGVYFVRLRAGKQALVRKMLFLK